MTSLIVLFRSLDMTRLAATKVPNGPFLAFFKEKVTLSQKDINRTSDTVNDIVPQILEKIRTEDKRFALKILHTGNTVLYYPLGKVSDAKNACNLSGGGLCSCVVQDFSRSFGVS